MLVWRSKTQTPNEALNSGQHFQAALCLEGLRLQAHASPSKVFFFLALDGLRCRVWSEDKRSDTCCFIDFVGFQKLELLRVLASQFVLFFPGLGTVASLQALPSKMLCHCALLWSHSTTASCRQRLRIFFAA